MPPTEHKEALIVVKTYPLPAKQGVEVSCTAAITRAGEWLRLFPVPFRYLDEDKRFQRYQWIRANVRRASDARPESYKLEQANTIQLIGEPLPTEHQWRARKDVIAPLQSPSLCDLQRRRNKDGSPTLGFFKPREIKRLIIRPEKNPQWSESQLATLRQQHLFEQGPQTELEKIPYTFLYEFRCDDAACNGHTLSCTDWEIGQSYRKWTREYGSQWEEKLRQRYETDMCVRLDTHFFVGTVHQHPDVWIIVGLFYPPKVTQPNLLGF